MMFDGLGLFGSFFCAAKCERRPLFSHLREIFHISFISPETGAKMSNAVTYSLSTYPYIFDGMEITR